MPSLRTVSQMSDVSLDTLQLDTPRLILRVPRLADLDSFAALMADEETARFLGGVAPREMTWRFLMTMIGAWHATGISMFSVFEKATGRWVGRLGPWRPEGWPGAEVGWAIVRDCGAAAMQPKAQRPRWPSRSIGSDGPTSFTPSRRTTAHRNRSCASSGLGIGDPGACRRRSRTLPWRSGVRRARSGARDSGGDRLRAKPWELAWDLVFGSPLELGTWRLGFGAILLT